jgi:hypothetical protein
VSASKHERVEPASIYDLTVADLLIDPVAAAREVDELLILWHVEQQRK